MSKPLFYTPVKRSQLITTSGVGALVRTRNGVTALVRGLVDWEKTVPVPSDAEGAARDIFRERFYKEKKLKLRDPELESACNVPFFIQPQSLKDDPKTYEDWLIPVVRFPLAGFCTNWQCGRILHSLPDDRSVARCQICEPLKPKPVQQMPIFLVCKAGHIQEIDWLEVVHENCTHGCASRDLNAKPGSTIKRMSAECISCGCKANPDLYEISCQARKAWLPDSIPDSCTEVMAVVERTSVQVYYANIKSALHMPAPENLDDLVLDYLLNFEHVEDIDAALPTAMTGVIGRIKNHLNLEISAENLSSHIKHIQDETNAGSRETWDQVAARERELDLLTGGDAPVRKYGVSLLEKKNIDLSKLPSDLFGSNGIFEQVVAVQKLSETRILEGFSRHIPEMPGSRAGQTQMWGLGDAKSRWLPGYRVYGEGILFVLNRKKVSDWNTKVLQKGLANISTTTLIHSLSHLILSQAALDCGYQVAGIRDRIYVMADGRSAFLVYAADGDSVGTLGGLVELTNQTLIDSLVREALREGEWCAQDPVCISENTFQLDHSPGACHQCLLMPETSCECFNKNLDRATIFGNSERGIPAFI